MIRARFAATAFAVLPLLAACSSDSTPAVAPATSSSAASSTAPARRTAACKPVPPQGAPLEWLPADLPLPDGSFPIPDTDAGASPAQPESDTDAPDATHRGFIAVKGTVDDFKTFVKTTWAASGWTLGKGDAEPGEAEGGYRKGDFGGAYRVRDVYCDPTMSELLITYGKGATTG